MRRIPHALGLILIAGLLISNGAANAQAPVKFPPTPLMLGIRSGPNYVGDIWAWGGTGLARRTRSAQIYWPIVSPVGDRLVYQQPPKQVTLDDSILVPPKDIYMQAVNGGPSTAIAVQPPDFSFNGDKPHYILRSEPSWSPDGNLLAWTEMTMDKAAESDPGHQPESLVIYDTVSKTLKTIVPHLTAHRSIGITPRLSEVSFGPYGLTAVKVFVNQDLDANERDWLYVYNASGSQLAEIKDIEDTEAQFGYGQLIWLTGFSTPTLSCISCSISINATTGDIKPIDGTLEAYSMLAPDKLSIYYGTDSGTEANTTWIIALDGKPVSAFDSVRIARMPDLAIAPDGLKIAGATYEGQGTTAGVFIYNAQTKKTAKLTTNVLGLGWGPLAWRVHAEPGT